MYWTRRTRSAKEYSPYLAVPAGANFNLEAALSASILVDDSQALANEAAAAAGGLDTPADPEPLNGERPSFANAPTAPSGPSNCSDSAPSKKRRGSSAGPAKKRRAAATCTASLPATGKSTRNVPFLTK
ncbi:hypothetical protein BV25DRAFT_1919499 [Artomyces pyxidatus]|uniref:Uncharacterized protein n=1 Tax=Artomyces pyxidatus TaxID=48021 RepID=A0ACB8SP87_9AGAM|nr:hypothetical protein BV25DRAFT_1919499 [Artomyces pyxidatus]